MSPHLVRLPIRVALTAIALLCVVNLGVTRDAQAQTPAPVTDPPAADTSAADPKNDDEANQATQLGKVEVRGKRNLFEDQALRRKKLMEGSVPCMGCDAKTIEHKPGFFESIANYGLNQVTPQAQKEKDEAGAAASAQVNERDFPTNRNP